MKAENVGMDSNLKERLMKIVHLIVRGDVEIHDEVLLQKLLSHVEKLKREADFLPLEEMNLDQLIMTLISIKSEPQCQSFGINFISIGLKFSLSLNEETSKAVKSLLDHWIKSVTLQEDASFCGSILEMLSTIAQNTFLIELLVSRECIENSINCLQSKNIYIRTAAQNFLSCIIGKTTSKEGLVKFPTVSIIAKETLSYLLAKLIENTDDGIVWTSTARLLLPIIKNICLENKDIAEQLRSPLLNLLSQKDRSIRSAVCEVYAIVLALTSSQRQMVDEAVKLIDDPLLIQKFAGWMLLRMADSSSDISRHLFSFILLPLQSTTLSPKDLSSAVDNLRQFLKVLTDNEFRQTILHQLCTLLEASLTEKSLFGVQRLQIAILDCFLNATKNNWPISFENGRRLAKLTSLILENRNVQCLTLTKSLAILGQLIKRNHCNGKVDEEMTIITNDVLNSIGLCLTSLLCHPEWEIRDSAVELISHLAKAAQNDRNDAKGIETNLLNNNLPQMTWEQLAFEEESFVRSSVLLACLNFSKVPNLWNSLIKKYSKEAIVIRILHLALEDSEEIVRRTACKLLSAWFLQDDFSMYTKNIKIVMQEAMKDFDWEVKLEALEFWKKLFVSSQHSCKITQYVDEASKDDIKVCSDEENDKYLEFLNELNSEGFCFSMLQAIDDCDVCVKLQAAQFLQIVKRIIIIDKKEIMVSFSNDDETSKDAKSVEPQYVSIPFDSEMVESILRNPDKDTLESLMVKQKKSQEENMLHPLNKDITTVRLDLFLEKLHNSDLDAIVKELQKSTDLHEENIEYLLDDLLPLEQNTDNIIIDCY